MYEQALFHCIIHIAGALAVVQWSIVVAGDFGYNIKSGRLI